jgi:hypothetical protein
MAADGNGKVFRVYAICPRENDKPYWLNIGLAFPHKDGKGFNVNLQALPLQDKLVIREYDPAESADDAAIADKFAPAKAKAATGAAGKG